MLWALLLAAATDLSRPPVPDAKDGPVNYPPHAFRANRQGTAFYRATINTDGKPTSCIITQSSGTRDLDEATCAFVMERGHFQPARDTQGRPAEATFANKVIWSIPRW